MTAPARPSLFGAPRAKSTMTDITGTRVVLDKDWCCQPHMIVARRKRGGFERCECNSRKGRLSETVASFLQDMWRTLGPPRAPIYLTRDRQGTAIMNREDVFPSRYFKAANLPQPRNLTIVAAKMEEMKPPEGGETQNRLVLHFHDEGKAARGQRHELRHAREFVWRQY
jgi:hypothetical protein